MNREQFPGEEIRRSELIDLLSGRNAEAGLAVGERTRRALHISLLDRRDRRIVRRRSAGITAFAFSALLLLLAPALWSSLDDFLGGEHFMDVHVQIALLISILFSAMLAALIASRKTHDPDADRGEQ